MIVRGHSLKFLTDRLRKRQLPIGCSKSHVKPNVRNDVRKALFRNNELRVEEIGHNIL